MGQIAVSRGNLLTRPTTVWVVAWMVMVYGAYRFTLSGYAAYRLFVAEHTGSHWFLAMAVLWLLPCVVAGIGIARRKPWSRYLVYLVTVAAVLTWLNGLRLTWLAQPTDLDWLVISVGSVSVVVLLFSSACVFLYFRGPVDVALRPPRWWIGVYVLAGAWIVLVPVFAANAHHFGPGFFPLIASIVVIPIFAVLLAADFVLRMVDLTTVSDTPIARRRWAGAISGALFASYAFVFYLF